MKLQNLAVIFIIIILPISIILNAYVENQVKTLNLQTSYDTKLNNATYDALKAFQLNTINSDSSDLSNSKLRDIEASANTFFNSIASNFNMAGYNKDVLTEYVPALVYTMYDGYYIYSPYTNTLDSTNKEANEWIENGEIKNVSDAEMLSENYNTNATYKEGERLSGLKPYIYYSCRYKPNKDSNFVITYSLDNYITIQGEINGKWVFNSGYLLDNVEIEADGNVTYRGVKIEPNETLEEYVYNPATNKIEKHQYIKLNGVKYYKEIDSDSWFSILNGEKYPQDELKTDKSTAIEYYKEAYKFKQSIQGYGLNDLKANNAIDENGQNLVELDENGSRTTNAKFGDNSIFDFGSMNNGKSIEDPNSNFNQHRLAVIRYSIEKNLSIAIANYNTYSNVKTANFQMPTLKEDEWEKIINNVSIISFLQGLSIGGKIYNGYSIITNNKNQEVVNEDSIFILTEDNQYHRANDRDLTSSTYNNYKGVLNIDFERKSNTDSDGTIRYFIPQQKDPNNTNEPAITGCYTSIVTQSNVEAADNFYQYMQEKDGALATAYFTALGRERYGMYKTNNNPDVLKEYFGVTI